MNSFNWNTDFGFQFDVWIIRRMLICLITVSFFQPFIATAQTYDTVSVFKVPVQLDSFVVSSGFDVDAFIRRVRTDTTFYKAFKNMRFVSYDGINDIKVYDKRGGVNASLHNKTVQTYADKCRSTIASDEQVTGDFYKRNGDYRYYTAALYAYLFFAQQPICNESDASDAEEERNAKGTMAKSKNQLKQLIFNPGSKIKGVPFMGDRESIFDEGEAGKYDFNIRIDTLNGLACYKFRITPKSGFERKVLYNELTTWFRKEDYSILARDYSLSYSTLVYDFDVQMKVRTKEISGKLYPTSIDYNGNWHIFSKKRERVRFKAAFTY